MARKRHAQNIEMLVLQGTTLCNLNCSYCYLSAEGRRSNKKLSIYELRVIFDKVFKSGLIGNRLLICWHSGEPLVLGIEYYREVFSLIDERAIAHGLENLKIIHDFQTNGVLLSDDWLDFFEEHHGRIQLGISCDGPAQLHDQFRRSWSGRKTHRDLEEKLFLLKERSFSFSAIAVVEYSNLDKLTDVVKYFKPFSPSLNSLSVNLPDRLPSNISCAEISEISMRLKNAIVTLLEEYQRDPLLPLIRDLKFLVEKFEDPAFSTDHRLSMEKFSEPLRVCNIFVDGTVSAFYAGSGDPYAIGQERHGVIGNIFSQELREMLNGSSFRLLERAFDLSHQKCREECEFSSFCSGGYNFIKKSRFGSYETSETPECAVQVKAKVSAVQAWLTEDR